MQGAGGADEQRSCGGEGTHGCRPLLRYLPAVLAFLPPFQFLNPQVLPAADLAAAKAINRREELVGWRHSEYPAMEMMQRELAVNAALWTEATAVFSAIGTAVQTPFALLDAAALQAQIARWRGFFAAAGATSELLAKQIAKVYITYYIRIPAVNSSSDSCC